MRNCLVVLKNKKLWQETAEYFPCVRAFAAEGIYFDKVAVVAYDSSKDIVAQLKDCRENFENTVILCPRSMEETLKEFLEPLYGGDFDMAGTMDGKDFTVFLYFTDGGNAASFSQVAAYLAKKYGKKTGKSYIKAVGAPRAEILKAVEKAKKINPALECNIYESYGDCTIEVVYSETDPKMMVDEVVRTFVAALDKYIYALEDITLAERLYQLLKLRRMKISAAESFTGGGIGQRLVEVPGISEVYFEGLNTYANEAKIERLGVQEMTIKSTGAVSGETAYQMAMGLINQGHCDVSVATTGIAGPKSDNTAKPVGLCYIAVGLKEGASVYKYNFSGDRKTITDTAINYALFLVYKHIK